MPDALSRRPAEEDARGEFGSGRRSLDPEAALTCAPEEVRLVGCESVYGEPVRGEAPQACPAALDALGRPVDDLLEPRDRCCDVDLFRRRIAGIRGNLVVRT